jgi:LPXTG-site transpeptidase (sortase) family protein
MTDEKFFTERDKALGKILFFVFLMWVVVLNWSDISWFLNIRTAPQIISQSIGNIFSREDEEKKPDVEKEKIEEEKEEMVVYCDENRITISAIDISVPLVEMGGTSEEEYRKALDRGVIHFPGSTKPGEDGLTVLLGHSAPPGWPRINHDWVFTDIDKLEEGDEIEICFNNIFTVYTVLDEEVGKKIYEVGEDVPPLYPGEDKKEAVIMSCWPPGSSENRIGVRAVVEK